MYKLERTTKVTWICDQYGRMTIGFKAAWSCFVFFTLTAKSKLMETLEKKGFGERGTVMHQQPIISCSELLTLKTGIRLCPRKVICHINKTPVFQRVDNVQYR